MTASRTGDPADAAACGPEPRAPGEPGCADLPAPLSVAPSSRRCELCAAVGRDWVSLRVCLTCGHVGCCDNSPGRHATGHHSATGHPVVASGEPGERWQWCYGHERAWQP